MTVRRNVKDSVFSDFFSDKKNMLKMYKILHPEDTEVTEDDVEDITIKNDEPIEAKPHNDLGFLVKDRLIILVEAQSTWSENIVVRMLLYLAQTYTEYIDEHELDVYSSTKIRIPKPELYVIYTGDRKRVPDVLNFKEVFFNNEEVSLNFDVKILHIGNTREIVLEYIMFCKILMEQKELTNDPKEAIKATIEICKDRDIMREYLSTNVKKVGDIMLYVLTEEYRQKVEKKRIEREKEEAVKQTEIETKIKTAKKLILRGQMTEEDIAEMLELPLEEIVQLKKTM